MNEIETTDKLMLDFSKISSMKSSDVIPVAVQNYATKEVILIAYINEIALKKSLELRKLVLWSTSRNELWFKGETSGNTFTLEHVFVNCEQNSLVMQVTPENGNICHTSYNGVANNCFYREYDIENDKLINLNKKTNYKKSSPKTKKMKKRPSPLTNSKEMQKK